MTKKENFTSSYFMRAVYMQLMLEVNILSYLIKMRSQYRQHYHNDYNLK